jgi:hypothetical protein
LAPKEVIAGPTDPGWMRTIVRDPRSKLRRVVPRVSRRRQAHALVKGKLQSVRVPTTISLAKLG